MIPLAQPPKKDERTFDDWVYRMWKRISDAAGIAWALIDKTGSNLTDLVTRNHADLQNINTASYTHLSSTNATDLTDGGLTTLHQHDFDNVLYPASYKVGTPTHLDKLQYVLNHEWSAGIVDGCVLTNNGDGTVSITAGEAVLRAVPDGHTTLYFVSVPAQNNIALTDDSGNYIYLDYNAGVIKFSVSTSITSFNCMDKCIAYLVHRRGNVTHEINATEQNVDYNRKQRQLLLKVNRFIHAQNGTVLGAVGLALTLTAGEFFFMLQSLPHSAFDTTVAGTANVNVFTLWYRNIGVWVETINQKVIDTTVYDTNAGTTTTLGNNKYGVSWVYIMNNNPSELHVVMGQVEYPNLSSAQTATPPASVPSEISALGVLVGYVVYEKSVTVFDNVYSAFTQAFSPSFAATHNGLSLIQTTSLLPNDNFHLAALQAALIPTGTPSVGQVPIATSATTSAWGTVSGGSGALYTIRQVASFRV